MNFSPGSKPRSQVQSAKRRPASQAQNAAFVAIIGVIGIALGALYLAQATATATTGTTLLQLQRTRDSLQRANDDLESQIALKRDIDILTNRAEQIGFVTPSGMKYIVVEGYYPDRATSTPTLQPTATVVYDLSFSGWVQQQVDQAGSQFEAWAGRARPTPTYDAPTPNP